MDHTIRPTHVINGVVCTEISKWPVSVIFSGYAFIRLGTILGRFSIIYFSGLGLRIRVMVWVTVMAWVRVRLRVRVRVNVVLLSG